MPPRRTHDFTGVPRELVPTLDDALDLIDRIDEDAEIQRMRLLEVFDWLETAVTDQVSAERSADALAARLSEVEAELEALRGADASLRETDARLHVVEEQLHRTEAELAALRATKLFRIAGPFRRAYGRVRRRT